MKYKTKINTASNFLGMLLLGLGVISGVILVTQPQLLNQNAQGVGYCMPGDRVYGCKLQFEGMSVTNGYQVCLDNNKLSECKPSRTSTASRVFCPVTGSTYYDSILKINVKLNPGQGVCTPGRHYNLNCPVTKEGVQTYKICMPVGQHCTNLGYIDGDCYGTTYSKDAFDIALKSSELSKVVCFDDLICKMKAQELNLKNSSNYVCTTSIGKNFPANKCIYYTF